MKDKEPIVILLVIFILLGLGWDSIKKGSFNTIAPTPTPQATVDDTYNYPSDDVLADTTHSFYYNKVTLSYVAGVTDPDPSRQYISLFVYLDPGEKVNVTGWKLISERTGNWVRIGQAYTLPKISSVAGDIILASGDTLNIIKGFSPIGISFQTNKCSGFFGEDRQFYPYLDRFCPAPNTEKLPKFSKDLDRDDECRELINRIPSCSTPSNYMNLNRLADTVTQSCKDYLKTKINYNTCVANHITDADFVGHEWYYYLNLLGPLWRDSREKITLYDNKGLMVSSISY